MTENAVGKRRVLARLGMSWVQLKSFPAAYSFVAQPFGNRLSRCQLRGKIRREESSSQRKREGLNKDTRLQ